MPVPDGALEAYHRKVRTIDGRILVQDSGDDLHLRLYDVLTGKDVWHQRMPAGSTIGYSEQPHLVAVVTPKGDVTVFDLAARRELLKTHVEPKHLEQLKSTVLFGDSANSYLALVREAPRESDGTTTALFQVELTSVDVNGWVYAFDRATGKRRWFANLPGQAILFDRFADLPIVICASRITRNQPNGMPQVTQRIRVIDKTTGKTLYSRDDVPKMTEPFHTLRVDPRTGIIDLIAEDFRLRHMPK